MGIDLVARKRIRRFLKAHALEACEKILSPGERRQWRSNRFSPLLYSKFFAAKEAFFKAEGGRVLGPNGMALLEVTFADPEHFSVRNLKKEGPGAGHVLGQIFRHGNWIGAQVILWQ